MKNYWLNRKKWIKIRSNYGVSLIMTDKGEPEHLNISPQSMACSMKDGTILSKMTSEKEQETLEMIEAEFTYTSEE